MNNIIKANSFAKLYKEALELLINEPDFECSPRGQKIKECLNVTLVLTDPLNNLFDNEVRKYPKKYLANELYLYLIGENSGQEFGKHAKLWLELLNSDGTINSAYGYLIFKKRKCLNSFNRAISQWEWAVESLKKDKDSRQAILHYNTPDHQYSGVKDFVCTLHNQFFIRENKLYMNYAFRSQDIWFGTTFDLSWATVLHQLMRLELLQTYPELELGTLTYTCASFHLYERNFEKAKETLQYPFFDARLPKMNEIPECVHSDFYKLDSEGKRYIPESRTSDVFWNWIMENK